jgi:hypothetical protein
MVLEQSWSKVGEMRRKNKLIIPPPPPRGPSRVKKRQGHVDQQGIGCELKVGASRQDEEEEQT